MINLCYQSQIGPQYCLAVLNFPGTLPLLADDTELYFTEIFETIRQKLFQLPPLTWIFPSVSLLPLPAPLVPSSPISWEFWLIIPSLGDSSLPARSLCSACNPSLSGCCLSSPALCMKIWGGRFDERSKGKRNGGHRGGKNRGRVGSWGFLWKGEKVKPERNW